jgi:cytochrome P450
MALSGMNDLKAVIMETQRLRPIVHFTRRHAAHDFEFAGYRVPAGTNILVANSCCHFLEEFYETPFSFRPQRFLEGGKFAPRTNGFFGGGVHICVGRNFSMLQTPLAVARMLKYYEINYTNEPEMKILAEETGRSLPASIPASFRYAAVA